MGFCPEPVWAIWAGQTATCSNVLCTAAAGAVCACSPSAGAAGGSASWRSRRPSSRPSTGWQTLLIHHATGPRWVLDTFHGMLCRGPRFCCVCLQPPQPAQHLFLVGGNNAADWLDTVDIFTVRVVLACDCVDSSCRPSVKEGFGPAAEPTILLTWSYMPRGLCRPKLQSCFHRTPALRLKSI